VCRSLSGPAEKVLGGYDIDLATPFAGTRTTFRVKIPEPNGLAESLFYPKGSIRGLDDEIFAPRMANLGCTSRRNSWRRLQ